MLESEGLSDYLQTYIISIYNVKFIKRLTHWLEDCFWPPCCWHVLAGMMKSATIDSRTPWLYYLPFRNVRVISAVPFAYATVVFELSTADAFPFPLALEP